MRDVPGIVLSATIWAYWTYVGALAFRVRRRTRKLAGIVPSQPLEQLMWVIWVPLVAAWATLPYLAATRSSSPWELPDFARHPSYAALRWAAAGVAIVCLALSIRCWSRMGNAWRMAVTPGQETELITGGPYAYVRHPIYALSILLMLCTAIVVPTVAVAAMAAVHITLMIVKAYNEERFLLGVHGLVYEDYRRRTRRFVPLSPAAQGARLNLFQRMMLRWRDLHPYNPVHVVHVPVALDLTRLRATIAEHLQQCGLTGLKVDRRSWRFCYQGGPAVIDVSVVTAANDIVAALSQVITREINRPFEPTVPTGPFRFIAVDAGASFELALVYDHFIASGDSIARMLTAIVCSYRGGTSKPLLPHRYPPTYRTVFMRHPMAAARAVLGLPRLIAGARRAHRPPNANSEDLTNAFTYFRLDAGQCNALDRARHAWGVTLNDLLLAILLQALAPLAEARRGAHRNELVVASILNMRAEFDNGADRALSPFLAAFRIGHEVPAGIGLKTLAADVHAKTVRVRRNRLYLQSVIALGLSALLWRFLSNARRARIYPKHYPAWAGLTTLNVDAVWAGCDELHTRGLDYLRAVPTGPLCPMVFAVTSVRGQLHVGVSFRTAAYSPASVDRVTTEFMRGIEELAREGP